MSSLTVEHEIIVADGGSRDGTCDVAIGGGCTVISTSPGRGIQLAAGVRAARGEWLLIIHADARIAAAALAEAEMALTDREISCAVWQLEMMGEGRWMWIVERVARWRSSALGLPYGDQGLLIRRELYDAAGGFPELPIMEDVALVRRVGRLAPIRHFTHAIRADSRRYQKEGAVRRVLLNVALLTLFLCGVPAAVLARRYLPHREPG
ncbi:MAG: TIGR04283 family arsenosugar biosynthesis glycosyltransferase [Gemmatimonadota bacterium]